MRIFKNKIYHNASWIIVCKVLQSALAFIVGVLSARYLGPSNYGLINYAASMVTFVLPICQLGLNNTLVHELACNPEKEGKILGTSMILSGISSLACMVGVLTFSAIADSSDVEAIIVVAIYGVNLIFQALGLIQYWFQFRLLSKYSSIASLVAYTAVSVYKLLLLITQKNVYWFAASYAIDYFLIVVFLLLLYKKHGGQKLQVDFKFGFRLVSKSKYYILTGLMTVIYSQTDKIMLKYMIDEEVVGYYAAAVAVSTITSFVFAAIIDSFRPIIFSMHDNEVGFETNIKRLYAIIIFLAVLQGCFMSIFARPCILILYGNEFLPAVDALRVAAWFNLFSYVGSVRNIWILAKNKQQYLWIINLCGAVINVILNLALIPSYGIVGASLASLVTQIFSNFILGFLLPPIKESNHLLLNSLHPSFFREFFKR